MITTFTIGIKAQVNYFWKLNYLSLDVAEINR